MTQDTEHMLITEPQPIADQMMVKCVCGWRQPVSLYEFGTKQAINAEVQRLYEEHLG